MNNKKKLSKDYNTLNKNGDVVKTNEINEDLYTGKYTLPELRLFAVYLSRINTKESGTTPESRTVRFSLDEFKELTGLKRVCKSDLLPSLKHLLGRQKIVESPDSTEDNCKVKILNLFSGAYFEKSQSGTNFVEISATEEAIPYLFAINEKFVQYKLWNILKLTSKNQIRMYEVLKQYISANKPDGWFECNIDRLKYLLGIPAEKYPEFKSFKRSVIDKCKEAINKHTDIYFEYKCSKMNAKGKWEKIHFDIKKNPASTATEFEKSLGKHIDIEAETRAAVFSPCTVPELIPANNSEPEAVQDLPSSPDLTREQLTSREPEQPNPAADDIRQQLLKAAEQEKQILSSCEPIEQEETEIVLDNIAFDMYMTAGTMTKTEILEIKYALKCAGYEADDLLERFSFYYYRAINKKAKKIKEYIIQCIENEKKAG